MAHSDLMPAAAPVVVVLNGALRLADNDALAAAYSQAAPEGALVLVHTVDPQELSAIRLVGVAAALAEIRKRVGGRVLSLLGRCEEVVPAAVARLGARQVFAQRCFEPPQAAAQQRLHQALAKIGARLSLHGSAYVVNPGTVLSGSASPYKVFTPFAKAWKATLALPPAPLPPQPLPPAPGISQSATPPDSAQPRLAEEDSLIAALAPTVGPGLSYEVDPLAPLVEKARATLPTAARALAESVSESQARSRWHSFAATGLEDYELGRDRPDLDATSLMSPHLAAGTIHPAALLQDVAYRVEKREFAAAAAEKFLSELAWREFFADQLHHRPDVAERNADRRFDRYRWHESETDVAEWSAGRTGFPIVDAGMRQLAQTGWMHNRVRMIVASFLVKDLHLRWQVGAEVFRQRLLDYSLASNQLSWQWCAGSGFDASPFFRVFNPTRQGHKFDPQGDYVRRWVPELAEVPGKAVHDLPDSPLLRPPSYPAPMVHHDSERKEALRRFELVKDAPR